LIVQKCDVAIAAGAEAFTNVYNAVWESIVLTEKAQVEAFLALLQSERIVRLQGCNPQQRTAKPPELYADAARARTMATVTVEALAAKCGFKPDAPPPLKAMVRILEKAYLRPDAPGNVDRICDVVRDMVSVGTAEKALEVMLAILKDDNLVIVRIKDRFRSPSGGGWRDVMVNYYHKSDEAKHVCELQIVHTSLLTARKGLPGHAIYNAVRIANELLERLGLQKGERVAGVRQLLASGRDWAYLRELGLTMAEVRQMSCPLVELIAAGWSAEELKDHVELDVLWYTLFGDGQTKASAFQEGLDKWLAAREAQRVKGKFQQLDWGLKDSNLMLDWSGSKTFAKLKEPQCPALSVLMRTKQFEPLRHLKLQQHRMGSEGFLVLLTAVREGAWANLEALELWQNHLEDKGLTMLTQVLYDGLMPKLSTLHVDQNVASEEVRKKLKAQMRNSGRSIGGNV